MIDDGIGDDCLGLGGCDRAEGVADLDNLDFRCGDGNSSLDDLCAATDWNDDLADCLGFTGHVEDDVVIGAGVVAQAVTLAVAVAIVVVVVVAEAGEAEAHAVASEAWCGSGESGGGERGENDCDG